MMESGESNNVWHDMSDTPAASSTDGVNDVGVGDTSSGNDGMSTVPLPLHNDDSNNDGRSGDSSTLGALSTPPPHQLHRSRQSQPSQPQHRQLGEHEHGHHDDYDYHRQQVDNQYDQYDNHSISRRSTIRRKHGGGDTSNNGSSGSHANLDGLARFGRKLSFEDPNKNSSNLRTSRTTQTQAKNRNSSSEELDPDDTKKHQDTPHSFHSFQYPPFNYFTYYLHNYLCFLRPIITSLSFMLHSLQSSISNLISRIKMNRILRHFNETLSPILSIFSPIISILTKVLTQILTKLKSIKTHLHLKFRTLSPLQKLLVLLAIVAYKFLQAWLIVRIGIWVYGSASKASGTKSANIGNIGNGASDQLGTTGQFGQLGEGILNQRLQPDAPSLEHRSNQQMLDGSDRGDALSDVGANSQTTNAMDTPDPLDAAPKKVLCIVTVVCHLDSHHPNQELHHNEPEDTNMSQTISKSSKDSTKGSFDTIIKQLVDNVQSMMEHPFQYQVDVYWILGCRWEDLTEENVENVENDEHKKMEDALNSLNSSNPWEDQLRNQLPMGVGLELWEDAMPLEYPLEYSYMPRAPSALEMEAMRDVNDIDSALSNLSDLSNLPNLPMGKRRLEQSSSVVSPTASTSSTSAGAALPARAALPAETGAGAGAALPHLRPQTPHTQSAAQHNSHLKHQPQPPVQPLQPFQQQQQQQSNNQRQQQSLHQPLSQTQQPPQQEQQVDQEQHEQQEQREQPRHLRAPPQPQTDSQIRSQIDPQIDPQINPQKSFQMESRQPILSRDGPPSREAVSESQQSQQSQQLTLEKQPLEKQPLVLPLNDHPPSERMSGELMNLMNSGMAAATTTTSTAANSTTTTKSSTTASTSSTSSHVANAAIATNGAKSTNSKIARNSKGDPSNSVDSAMSAAAAIPSVPVLAPMLAPSISKLMKQHRYVVRDKLQEYDVFLSFSASLSPSNAWDAWDVSGASDTPGANSDGTYAKSNNSNRLEANGSNTKMLERITGGHIQSYLNITSDLNAWRKFTKNHKSGSDDDSLQNAFPALLSVDVAVKRASNDSTNDTANDGKVRIDPRPCCQHLLPEMELVSSTYHVPLEIVTKDVSSPERTAESATRVPGGVVGDWKLVEIPSLDGEDSTRIEEAGVEQSDGQWLAIEKADQSHRSGISGSSADAHNQHNTPFFEHGWILTKEQLLRLHLGICPGKFLPPFNELENNDGERRRDKGSDVSDMSDMTDPLYWPKQEGGCGVHRALSLDPSTLSRQLVYTGTGTVFDRENELHVEGAGVNGMLKDFLTVARQKIKHDV